MNDTPSATAVKAIAGALVRQAITAAGAALVAHRVVDQNTADSITGPIGDYVLGLVLAGGSAAWSARRAWLSHFRWLSAWGSPARPLPGASAPPTA